MANKSSGTSTSDKVKKIVINSHKDGFVIDVDLFEKYSYKIKKLHEQDKLPKKLDLSNYDVKAVATLVDYMATGGHTKTRITTSILGDLMEISRVLEMKMLHEKIEEFVLLSAAQSSQFLMHALTMISKEMLLSTSLGAKVIDIAVSEFPRITKTTSFNDIPLDVVLRILDRCDLNLESEYDVAEAAISWLTAKPERVHSSYLVLSCIRIVNLTPEQRIDLQSLISTMPNYAKTVTAFAHYAFNNTNAYRVCVLAEHAPYKRCGNRGSNTEFTFFLTQTQTFKTYFTYRYLEEAEFEVVRATTLLSAAILAEIGEDDKTVPLGEAEDLKRTVFSVSQERRTTRAERMARYQEEDHKREENRRRRRSRTPVPPPPPPSTPREIQSKSTPSQSKSQRSLKKQDISEDEGSSGEEGVSEREKVVPKEAPKVKPESAKEKSPSSTKSKKGSKKSPRAQRKSAGSSPSDEDQSTFFSTTTKTEDGSGTGSSKSSSSDGGTSSSTPISSRGGADVVITEEVTDE